MHLDIYCEGVKLPSPSAISSGDELVWSTNTGRSTTADMIGDIIAEKETFSLKWEYITHKEYLILRNNLPVKGQPFKMFTIKTSDGDVISSIKIYRSTIDKEFLNVCVGSDVMYSSVSTDIVQV